MKKLGIFYYVRGETRECEGVQMILILTSVCYYTLHGGNILAVRLESLLKMDELARFCVLLAK